MFLFAETLFLNDQKFMKRLSSNSFLIEKHPQENIISEIFRQTQLSHKQQFESVLFIER
jgi:hypothetical protein